MKALLVTPTYDGKAYCDVRWSNSVNGQSFTNVRHFVADTSASAGYAPRLRTLLPNANVYRLAALAGKPINQILVTVHTAARNAMLTGAAMDCDAYVSWESDVIAPPNGLALMMKLLTEGTADIVMFEYPDRLRQTESVGGLGFTAFSREVIQALPWDANGGYGRVDDQDPECEHGVEGWLLRRAKRAGFSLAVFVNVAAMEHPNG